MPELPEVETIKLGLQKLLIGKTIKSIDFNWPKGFPNKKTDINKYLISASVKAVRRRAKVLIIDLDSGYSLVTHLKMTGQLVFRGQESFGAGHPNGSLVNELPDKSTRVIIEFADKSRLFFNDQRKFGWMRLLPTKDVEKLPFFMKVGPEPLDKSFSAASFIVRLKRRQNSAIKAALLDQTVIAGVGNIYADESLWAAKIHPSTKIIDISNKKLEQLYKGLIDILKLSIKSGGSTDRNYVDANGKRGSYLKFAKVFRREGQKCERCATTISKIRVAGRGTHICLRCQKAPK